MKDQSRTIKNRKKILIFVAFVVAFVVIASGTFLTMNLIKNSNTMKESSAVLKASADKLKAQALQAEKDNKDAEAVKLLEQAKSKYELAGDTNNTVDSEALIFLNNNK